MDSQIKENLMKVHDLLIGEGPEGVEFTMSVYSDHHHRFYSTECGSVGCVR